jgi:hypothetical protein
MPPGASPTSDSGDAPGYVSSDSPPRRGLATFPTEPPPVLFSDPPAAPLRIDPPVFSWEKVTPDGVRSVYTSEKRIEKGASNVITILAGPLIDTSISIPTAGLAIGRKDIDPEDRKISRLHVRVIPKGNRLSVKDLGSINGFLFKDRRVRNAILEDGEVFMMGTTPLRYEGTKGV